MALDAGGREGANIGLMSTSPDTTTPTLAHVSAALTTTMGDLANARRERMRCYDDVKAYADPTALAALVQAELDFGAAVLAVSVQRAAYLRALEVEVRAGRDLTTAQRLDLALIAELVRG